MTYRRSWIALPAESCASFIRTAAEAFPLRPAIEFEGQSISYAELAGQVEAVKRFIAESGYGSGSRIAICLPNSPGYVFWTLAALDLGAVVVPIHPAAPAAEMRAKCLAGRVEALVVEAGAVARRKAEMPTRPFQPKVLADLVEPAAQAVAPVVARTEPERLAMTPFSSGTTGEPKLILLSHQNLLASRLMFAQATALRSSSVLVHFLPLGHVYGWMALTAALGVGAKIVLHERYDFDRLITDVERHEATSVFAVPQTIIDLQRAPPMTIQRLGSLEWINTGSAPLAPSIMREVADRYGLAVTMGYGLTEAAPVTHAAVDRPELIDVESVGFAASGTAVRLVDPSDPTRPVSVGEAGEIVVAGPQVSCGYVSADGQLDRSAWLNDGTFRTGDMGAFDRLGRLRIVGRIKNIIKYNGYSVAPAELEAVLCEHPDVLDCTVLGQPDPEVGEIPTAFVVPRQHGALTAEALIAYVRERVAPQRRVREVVFVREIPRSSAGKVLVDALRDRV